MNAELIDDEFEQHEAALGAAERLIEAIDRTLAAVTDSEGRLDLCGCVGSSAAPGILADIEYLRDHREVLVDATETPCTVEELEAVAGPIREAWERVHKWTVDLEDAIAAAHESG